MSQEPRWQKLESGQALMEYWPTIPAAIMIIISAGLLTNFVRGAFGNTADALNRSSASVAIEVCDTTDEDNAGITVAKVDTHLIELVSTSYDGTNTTVVYRVTSSEKKALSHWTLEIPKNVADNIIDQSEPWGWTDNDPTTGAKGIKFDTGYDGGGDSQSKDVEEEQDEVVDTNNNANNNKNADKGNKRKVRTNTSKLIINARIFMQTQTTSSVGFADGESREIFLLLSGQYDFSETAVVTKSANNDGVEGTISAPVQIIDGGHTTTVISNCN